MKKSNGKQVVLVILLLVFVASAIAYSLLRWTQGNRGKPLPGAEPAAEQAGPSGEH